VIPGGTTAPAQPAGAPRDGGATLDDLFRRAVAARPDAPAVLDPPDREGFTDGAPRHLTWTEADRAVSAIANLLKSLGLPAGAIVALQLPNTVESVLTLMGVLRAGLIAAPLPLLWRQAEACAALGRISARVLVCCQRVGDVDHAELAMHAAAETFAIRFVCGFGRSLPDGIVPLDEVFDAALPAPPPALESAGDPAGRVALVTFEVTADGLVPVARSHRELIAAGEAVAGAAGIAAGATLLGALMTASFAGIGSTVLPWLLCGGTLWLHQPFNPAVLAAQRCDVALLPGPLLPRLIEAGLIGSPGPKTIVALWRAPERMAASPAWPGGDSLVDVPVFGEVGLVALRRGADGLPAPLPAPQARARNEASTAAVELVRGASGTLAMRGAMVPAHPCPPGSARGDQFNLKIGADGFVDTSFPCHVDRETERLVIDGPPAGIVSVGGYRFALRDLHDLVAPIDADGSVAALPDVLAGHRLAGVGNDRAAIRDTLADQGTNPLVVGAFRDKRPGRASAA
jgi:AMP-binding enzyme